MAKGMLMHIQITATKRMGVCAITRNSDDETEWTAWSRNFVTDFGGELCAGSLLLNSNLRPLISSLRISGK